MSVLAAREVGILRRPAGDGVYDGAGRRPSLPDLPLGQAL